MANQIEGQQPNRFAQGIFLELVDQSGALGTPMWVSLRDKPVLTKQINQATCFENAKAALYYLEQLDVEAICQGKGTLLTISARTYDFQAHKLFWDRLREGVKTEQHDYSFHMIRVRQLIDQLDHALLNGPEELARTLPRELYNAILDLNIAIDRLLNK